MDTWWQTETGMIMIAPPTTKQKPGSAMRPLPGVTVKIVDDRGRTVATDKPGHLVIAKPWPAMLRGIWKDLKRFRDTYWKPIKGYYFTNDRARKDADGDIWILGREDDMLVISGHNLSNAEVEAALTTHDTVVESAVVGVGDAVTGQRLVAFLVLKKGVRDGADLIASLNRHVARQIGPIAKPKEYYFVPDLPKTRSGKIMRRLLRDLLMNEPIGDTNTLSNPKSLMVRSLKK